VSGTLCPRREWVREAREEEKRRKRIVRGGFYRYNNGNLDDRGSDGGYWESKVNNATLTYYLSFASTGLYPQYNYRDKGVGFSARCVAR